jgi:hypothetical protein
VGGLEAGDPVHRGGERDAVPGLGGLDRHDGEVSLAGPVAERIVRQLINDLDGSEIAEGGGERVEFSICGVDYQIDLSATNAAKFDKALKPFVDGAMKLRGGRGGRGKTTSSRGSASKEHLTAIRAWARKNGHEVSDRGRIKTEVVEAFEAAH